MQYYYFVNFFCNEEYKIYIMDCKRRLILEHEISVKYQNKNKTEVIPVTCIGQHNNEKSGGKINQKIC